MYGEKRKMIKEKIAKLKAAGDKMNVWRTIYNNLCRKCQVILVTRNRRANNKGKAIDGEKTLQIINNHFCDNCKKMIKEKMEK